MLAIGVWQAGGGGRVVRSIIKGARAAHTNARPLVKKGIVSPRRVVPEKIPPPAMPTGAVFIKSLDHNGVEAMRRSSALAARVREFAGTLVRPGVTTDQIDEAVHEKIVTNGAYPSTLGFAEFPKSCCTSVNEVVVHGIPDSRPLEDGDIVSIDVCVYLGGYHGDCCGTFPVGNVDDAGILLMKAAREACHAGVAACGDGKRFADVGPACWGVAQRYGLDSVVNFCGHGVSNYLHLRPLVSHVPGGTPKHHVMRKGMTFTVEPALTEGCATNSTWKDGWTAATRDGSRCAQHEEIVLINDHGDPEILTDPSVWREEWGEWR